MLQTSKNITFADIDDFLYKHLGPYALSLDRQRNIATPFAQLAEYPKKVGLDGSEMKLSAKVWMLIVSEQLEAFPENIFWDYDYMFKCFIDEFTAAASPDLFAGNYAEQVSRLMRNFGQHSVIKFRYVHDFSYGFDWAKWVKKAPDSRKEHGPFSMAFMSYLEGRGNELEDLIAENDEKYHPLGDEEAFRNPFGFSREPEAETLLLMLLAKDDMVPVKLWALEDTPNWQKPYAEKRLQLSEALGIQA